MGLAENLAALVAAREESASKRKRRVSQLTNLVASIPDPEVDTGEDLESSLPAVQERLAASAAGGGARHSMGDGHGHGSQAEVNGLNAEFSKQLNALIKASGGKVSISSGYRSPERQAQLYAAAVKKHGKNARKWAAPPGKSNHNHGLAADLKFADAASKAWVHQNAAKYGLVFPMAHEPWHIEPVGARKKRK